MLTRCSEIGLVSAQDIFISSFYVGYHLVNKDDYDYKFGQTRLTAQNNWRDVGQPQVAMHRNWHLFSYNYFLLLFCDVDPDVTK